MSDNTDQVEQITKAPSATPFREKDPKKVAAGKKLAEKNKQMREEHAKYKALEAESNKRMREENEKYKTSEEERLKGDETSLSDGFLSQLTLGNVLSLLGVGLSIYALFFKGETKAKDTWRRPVETTLKSPEEKQPPKSKGKTKVHLFKDSFSFKNDRSRQGCTNSGNYRDDDRIR